MRVQITDEITTGDERQTAADAQIAADAAELAARIAADEEREREREATLTRLLNEADLSPLVGRASMLDRIAKAGHRSSPHPRPVVYGNALPSAPSADEPGPVVGRDLMLQRHARGFRGES